MSKPIQVVGIVTANGKRASVHAVFDTGSFTTIVRENCLPAGAPIERFRQKRIFGTAHQGGRLAAEGVIYLEIQIGSHRVSGDALVAPHLNSEMLIGAGWMQMWDISIRNKNGRTTLHVGRDMDDPEIQTVLSVYGKNTSPSP